MSAQNVQLIPQQQQPTHPSPKQETSHLKQPTTTESQPQFPPTSSSQIQEEASYTRMVNSKKSIKTTKSEQNKSHTHKLEAIEQILIELEKEEIRERKLQLIKIIYQKLLQDNEHIHKLTTALNQFHDQNQFLLLKINQLEEAHLKKEEFLLENYTTQYKNICDQFKESKKVLDDLDGKVQKILKFANNQTQYNGQIRKKIIQINNANIKEQQKLRVFVQQHHHQEQKKRVIFKQQVQKFQKMLGGAPPSSQKEVQQDHTLQKISQKAEEQHFSSQGNLSQIKSIHYNRNRNERRRSQTQKRIKQEINKIQEQNKLILRECLSEANMTDNKKPQQITLMTIVPYLQQTKTLNETYQTQLEIQIQILTKRLKEQSTIYKQYIGEQNQKIDQLMSKFQQLEEFRVRAVNFMVINNAQNKQKQENQQKCLQNQVLKLKEQNSQFTQICQKSKKQLQTQQRKVQNLQYQIRELSQQKQNIFKQKNDIISYNDKIKMELGARIQIQEAQLQANDRKIYELNQIIQQLQAMQVNYNANQQSIFQLESSIFQNQKFINTLQQKLQQKNQQELTYLDQLQSYKKQLKQLQQKLSTLQKEYQQKQQRYLHQKTILIKNNEDLKYLNTILKKDICKIQEIQAIDWQKQFQDSIFAKKCNTKNKVNKCMKVNKTSHFNFGDQLEMPVRSKNYSYTNSNVNTNVHMNNLGHSQINYGSSYNTSQKYTPNTIKSSYISTVNQNMPNYTKQNLTSSRIFMPRQTNTDKNTYFDTKLDLDFMNKKHSIQVKTQQDSQYYTERPLTELVKKKYQL